MKDMKDYLSFDFQSRVDVIGEYIIGKKRPFSISFRDFMILLKRSLAYYKYLDITDEMLDSRDTYLHIKAIMDSYDDQYEIDEEKRIVIFGRRCIG